MAISQETFIQYSPDLYNTAKKLADAYRNELRACNAVASGDLVNFNYDVTMEDGNIKLVFHLPKYWSAIESGRKPTEKSGSGVLFHKIVEWIEDKGIAPWVKYTKKDGTKVLATKSDMAWSITKSIHAEGYFKPNHHGKQPLALALAQTEKEQQEFIDISKKMIGEDVEQFVLRLK